MQKNLPTAEAFSKIFIRFWLDLLALVQFALKGKFAFAFSISKAHYHFFKQFSKTSAKRANHQAEFDKHKGVFSGSIVWAYFVGKINIFRNLGL